ncbi:hypothetical protein [Streptomyces sp. NPDC001401]|uniref:hypothetical protein n=1 Tax=Streptomyces sp. NPDC001401 TaxID=3364570 RepID=UPI003680D70C
MESVFEHADRLFTLLSTLVSRPKKGELPGQPQGRNGLPILILIREGMEERYALTEQIRTVLRNAEPRRVPHGVVNVEELSSRLERERPDLSQQWRQVELCRQTLVELAQDFSSNYGGRRQRVRFRRFGLVNWLLRFGASDRWLETHDRHFVRRRLRDRELQLRSARPHDPASELVLRETLPWWATLLALHVLPLVWLRAWRMLGREYRWLLRQPYMAPALSRTVEGFALRLAFPLFGREDPVQVTKLMVNAFLEDLRDAYRRTPWRRPASRRRAYCVALLREGSEADGVADLVRVFAEVRNEMGAFDPLLLIAVGAEDLTSPAPARHLEDPVYDIWRARFREAGGSRDTEFWYLPLKIPPPLPYEHPDWRRYEDRAGAAARIVLPGGGKRRRSMLRRRRRDPLLVAWKVWLVAAEFLGPVVRLGMFLLPVALVLLLPPAHGWWWPALLAVVWAVATGWGIITARRPRHREAGSQDDSFTPTSDSPPDESSLRRRSAAFWEGATSVLTFTSPRAAHCAPVSSSEHGAKEELRADSARSL